MAEKNFMRFIPPNLRGPLTDLGIFGRVAADNIYGLDDDYESTGEMLGTAFREDPVGLAKDLGTGIYEGAKDIYEDPKGAFEDLKTSLGETIDRLNTPYDQLDLSTEEAQRQRAGDLMIFGEALGAGGALTKGLVNLGKKQLREKVIQENPGLNNDQVNSIVEDRGYDPTEDFGYATPGFGDPFIDDGRRSPALEEGSFLRENTYGDIVPTDGFPVQVVPENTVPTNMEVPTVEGFEGIPIVTAAGRVIGSVLDPEEPDVDGNLYGPPDTFDENNPPEIEDLMEPNPLARLFVDTGQPYRVGDIVLDADMGEGVVTDDGMINYNGIRISSDRPVIGVDIDEVGRDIADEVLDGEPMTTFEDLVRLGLADPDDELARIETLLPQAQVAERVAARREAVAEFLSQRGLSPALAFDALAENNRPNLMMELREFVSQRTQQTLPSENDIFLRIESINSVPDFPDELTPLPAEAIDDDVMDAILLDEFGDRLPDDDADVPDGPAQAYDALFPTDTPTNTNVQGLDTTWLTQPGYGRFTDDATTPIDTNISEPAELAAGDIKLTGENSYLTSRMDTALSDLSQTQTKFASLEQLVNTLTKKYRVQPAELQARGIPTSQVEADLLFTNNFTPKVDFDFSKDKVDLNDPFYQNILNKDPFVVRTLGGADAPYPKEFTGGVTNYKVTIIGLENRPDLLKQGVMDPEHLMGHQTQIDGPTVVHIRTGEFPVQGGGYDRKKTFHLGEIQSQVEKNSRPSRKANDLVRDVAKKMELPDDLEFRIPEGFSINQLAEDLQSTANKIKDVRQLREIYEAGDTDALEKYFDSSTTFGYDGPKMVKSYAEITGITEADSYKRMAQARLVRISSEINEALDKYNIYKKGSDEVYTSGSLFLDDFEKNLVQMYNKRDDLNFLDPDETGPGDFLKDIMKFGGESFNASDYGVGSIFTTDRITRMGIKEALQQAVDTDADFFTLGTGQMAKDMTYGKLSGQIEYYDQIVPKMFRKIMGEISKDTGIKMPELRKRKMETLGDDGKVVVKEVLGIELTDELRDIFKSKKVQAFKEGGLATLSSSLRPKLRPGTLESLREKMYLAGPPIDDRQMEKFANLEFEYDLKELLDKDPIAALGFDPTKTRYTLPQEIRNAYYMRGRKGSRYTQDGTYLGEEDDVVYGPAVGASEDIIVHEYRHRGHEILRDAYFEDKEGFTKKYGQDVVDFITGEFEEIADGPLYLGDRFEEFRTELGDNLDATFIRPRPNAKQIAEMFPDMAGVFSEEELEKMGQELYTQIVNQADEPYEISPELKQEFFNKLVQGSVLEGTELVTKEDQEKYKGILSKVRQAASDILKERKGYERGGLVTLAKEVL
jgi:hypothetical protein